MCGRYAATAKPEDLVAEFSATDATDKTLGPDYNVAPTRKVHAVITRAQLDEDPVRQLVVMRWGLVPSWAKDIAIGSKMINARLETVTDKPAFRSAAAKRRCLLPADGWYEWYTPKAIDGATGKAPAKQPFFLHPADGSLLAMAGLYEFWRDKSLPEDDPHAWLTTCTVLTTAATDDVGLIHDRMPVVVPKQRWAEWLDPANTSAAEVMTGILPASVGSRIATYPVGTAVNNVRNNGAHLLDPLPAEPELTSPTLL